MKLTINMGTQNKLKCCRRALKSRQKTSNAKPKKKKKSQQNQKANTIKL